MRLTIPRLVQRVEKLRDSLSGAEVRRRVLEMQHAPAVDREKAAASLEALRETLKVLRSSPR